MVAVPHRDADKFISSSSAQTDVFIVFGSDAGLVSERTVAILKCCGVDPANPDQVTKFEGDDLSSNQGRLYEEAHGMGLFADKRAIVIRAGSKQITASLEALLESPASDCKVIVQAGVLRREAPLRKLGERARNAAAIECYPDQARDIERLVDATVKNEGLAIEPDARSALVGLLGDDRLSTRAELEKLVLYAYGSARITEDDVMNAVADASAFGLDNIVFAAFSGDLAFLGDASAEIYAGNSELYALLAAAARHAHMLHQILIETETGLRVEEAVDRHAGRTIFGPRKESLLRQARNWRRKDVAACIEQLRTATLESRREAALSSGILMQTLLTIARRYRAIRPTA